MPILGPNGQPIVSQRKVYLKVEIIDREPASPGAQVATLGFELDNANRLAVQALLSNINAQVIRHLTSIGFFSEQQRAAPMAALEPLALDKN